MGGDALVGAFVRLFGAQDSQGLRIALYAVIGLIVVVVVVYGYQFMLFVNRIAVWLNTVLMLLAIVAFSGTFNAGFAGTQEYLLGDFWPTFILSALIAMSNPISFGAFLGDWARYIPNGTSNGKLMLATRALGEAGVSRALVVTDSLVDLPLLDRCARPSTSPRWARTRSSSTATSCRPTAAPALPASPAPGWRSILPTSA